MAGLKMDGVRASVDCPPYEIFADPFFDKVFCNLIENALNYGGDKLTSVSITAQESDSILSIVCEDDGEGIAPDIRPHLFMRGCGKHTGPGLFLILKILAETDIGIQETSEPGKGARFEIVVPRSGVRRVG